MTDPQILAEATNAGTRIAAVIAFVVVGLLTSSIVRNMLWWRDDALEHGRIVLAWVPVAVVPVAFMLAVQLGGVVWHQHLSALVAVP